MSVRMMTLVFEHYPRGGSEMVLALALADHAHEDGDHIHPGIASLARKTRQSKRTVQYALRRMQASGWLELVREARGGRPSDTDLRRMSAGMPRRYRISPAWISAPANFWKEEMGANFAPINAALAQESVQPGAKMGAIAVAPESSLNRQEQRQRSEKAPSTLDRSCSGTVDGLRCGRPGAFGDIHGRTWLCRECNAAKEHNAVAR